MTEMPLKRFSTEMAEPRRAGKTSLDRETVGFLLEQGMGSQLMGIVGKGAGMGTPGFPCLQFHPSARERSLRVWSSSSGTRQGHSNTGGENTELLLFLGAKLAPARDGTFPLGRGCSRPFPWPAECRILLTAGVGFGAGSNLKFEGSTGQIFEATLCWVVHWIRNLWNPGILARLGLEGNWRSPGPKDR